MGVNEKAKFRGEWPKPLAFLHCSFLLIAAMRSPTVRFVHLGGRNDRGHWETGVKRVVKR